MAGLLEIKAEGTWVPVNWGSVAEDSVKSEELEMSLLRKETSARDSRASCPIF